MLETYKVIGIIYYSSHEVIIETFKDIFKDITARPRIFGFDISYKDETTEVVIKTHDNEERQYYVDIYFTGSELEFSNMKEHIKHRLLKADVLFDIGFLVQDDEGNEIEEEFIHPDFAKRFIPPGR
ncbi:hypothetical protein [Niastella sp. OAS944]|uniref:hypothetical protein n=1 Tax=Niastella sp. OAS944 TaxID=2664089 RepID=UPI003487E4FA|nr:hypothetical protein [Chitinophagaceae bacterium OAS944]